MKTTMKILAISLVSAFAACCITGCGPTELDNANELYEEGSYQEALAIYESIENPDEDTISKMDDCKWWEFVNYVRNSKEITINGTKQPVSDTLIEFTITASQDGSVSVERFTQKASTASVIESKLTVSIPFQASVADVSGEYEEEGFGADYGMVAGMSLRFEPSNFLQQAEGKLDMALYTYGDEIEWETDTNQYQEGSQPTTTNMGRDELDNNKDAFADTIKALGEAMTDSNTGCTLKIAGFDKLQ